MKNNELKRYINPETLKNRAGYLKDTEWLMSLKGLSSKAKLVFIKLLDCNGQKGCYPGHKYIEKKTGINYKTVSRVINEIIGFGLIEKIRVGKGCNNRYRFLYKCLELKIANKNKDSVLKDLKVIKNRIKKNKIKQEKNRYRVVKIKESDSHFCKSDSHIRESNSINILNKDKKKTSSLYVYDSTVENQGNRQRKEDINIEKEKEFETPEEINVQKNKNTKVEIDKDEKYGVCDDEVETFRKKFCERYPYQEIFSRTKNVRGKYRRFLFRIKNFNSDRNFIRNNGKYFDEDYILLLVSCIEDVGYDDMKPGNLLNEFMFKKIVRHYFTVWERGDPNYDEDQQSRTLCNSFTKNSRSQFP